MQSFPPADYRFDVAVIGAGIAGLVAATRCALDGLKVAVLEKSTDERHVCNSRLTGGIFHLAYHGVFEDQATTLTAIEDATGRATDPLLVGAVVRDANRVVRWLESIGIRFVRSSNANWHSHVLAPPALAQLRRRWEDRGGDMALRTLAARLQQCDGQMLRGHHAERLVLDAGRFAGVEGTRADGSGFAVAANAVVIADGGFQANRDELARHVSAAFDRIVQRNAGTGRGDGLRMARQIGAATTDLTPFYGHVLSRDALTNDLLWPNPFVDEIARQSVVVGPDGRRFADEGMGGIHLANALAHLPDPASALLIFDHAAWEGPGRQRAVAPNPVLESAGATIHTAATLDQLAVNCGLATQPFVDEVEAYNSALRDCTFDRLQPARTIRTYAPLPVASAPFYAIPIAPGITYTMGGIRIDQDARVLDRSARPIAGVYAAGGAIGGIEGGPHAGYVGGLSVAGVTGLRAAEHICATRKTSP